jgi:hypothetical protein
MALPDFDRLCGNLPIAMNQLYPFNTLDTYRWASATISAELRPDYDHSMTRF